MIGYSGLTAYQAAENTVANNISNVKTEGYSKQKVTQVSADALRTYTTYGMAGSGTVAKSVDQLRNEYFDYKYWLNEADYGRYTTQQTYMSRIENYFKDSSTINGFTTIYTENFYNALSELEKNPGSTTARTAFIGSAQTLTEYFNTMAINLEKEQESLNSEIKTQIERVNAIAEQISSLNKQINLIEIQNVTANELRDKRNLLVDELSQIVDITVDEQPIIDENTKEALGINYYKVTISNGGMLVDGYNYNTLECKSRLHEANQSDADGLFDIYWSNTGMEFSPLAANLSGSLKALMELRDGNNKESLTGYASAASVGETTYTMEISGYEDVTLDKFLADCDIPKEGIVTISGYKYYYSGWELSKDSTTGTYSLTFNELQYTDKDGALHDGLYADIPENTLKTSTDVTVGKNVDYQGIPYYQAQMNQWVREFAAVFNNIEKQGSDLNGNKMSSVTQYGMFDESTSFFQWTDVSGVEHGFTDNFEFDQSAFELPDNIKTNGQMHTFEGIYYDGGLILKKDIAYESYYWLTAKNFTVNADIVNDVSKMATTFAGNTEEGESEIDVSNADLVMKLEEIKTDKTMMSFRGASSSEFLSLILSDIALNTNNANTFTNNVTNIRNVISNQRLSVSGVDEDEEALDLVKFQNAYNLNSKVIQVMTEIYDRLILQTGV
ncbi:MAG: flagellar hook-associated protein FlgK [Lachnospiraceae bacterium]|nr:flagellar hook-associated protein FlgK [Lachnospiraceae bacterium]